jgi:hypothetical protein
MFVGHAYAHGHAHPYTFGMHVTARSKLSFS